MSRDFVDLIAMLHNSKGFRVQVDLFGVRVMENVSWVFVGVFSFHELGIPPMLRTQEIVPSREFWERVEVRG